jgi:ribulose kinase
MSRRSHASRLSDIVMDELAGEQTPWDLDKHLSGCLVGYQTDQSYGAAVHFALEALSGIAHDVAVRANAGKLRNASVNSLRRSGSCRKKASSGLSYMASLQPSSTSRTNTPVLVERGRK